MANRIASLALFAVAMTGGGTPWSAYGVVSLERNGSLIIQGSSSVESCLSVIKFPVHLGTPNAQICRPIKLDFTQQPPNIYIAVRVDPVPETSIFFGAATEHACQAARDRLAKARGAADLGCRGAVMTFDGEVIR
jgi:hypothetical protein